MTSRGRPWSAKLTDGEVEEIRRLYAEGGVSQAALGRAFDVSQVAVSKIVRGETYHEVVEREQCVNGHLLTAKNTYTGPRGARECRTCRDERRRAYKERNPSQWRAILKASKRRRRALTRGVAATLSALEWEAIKQAYGFRCAYCGSSPQTLEQDHRVPLAAGGQHVIENVIPACRSCNSRKGTKSEAEFRATLASA